MIERISDQADRVFGGLRVIRGVYADDTCPRRAELNVLFPIGQPDHAGGRLVLGFVRHKSVGVGKLDSS